MSRLLVFLAALALCCSYAAAVQCDVAKATAKCGQAVSSCEQFYCDCAQKHDGCYETFAPLCKACNTSAEPVDVIDTNFTDVSLGAMNLGGEAACNRQGVVNAAWALYNERSHEVYTEDGRRWSGINSNVRPPKAPAYSDCSSAATWCYWTVCGGGTDFVNGEGWKAGYTGSMIGHGRVVAASKMQPGDLCFYGHSYSNIAHVAIYVGSGKVVSHGHDPVGVYPYTTAFNGPLQQIRSYF